MNRKYQVFADNRFMTKTLTIVKAKRLAKEYTAIDRNGSFGSSLKTINTNDNSTKNNIWAFLNKKD